MVMTQNFDVLKFFSHSDFIDWGTRAGLQNRNPRSFILPELVVAVWKTKGLHFTVRAHSY